LYQRRIKAWQSRSRQFASTLGRPNGASAN
jgi:hypothetical protein